MAFLDSLGRGLSAFGAGVQGRGQEFLQGLNQDRQQAMLKDAQRVQQDLAAGNVAGARKLLKRRVELISKLGGDPSDTAGLLSQIDSGDVEGALGEASTLVSFAQQQGFLPKPAADKLERVDGQIVNVTRGTASDIQGFTPPGAANLKTQVVDGQVVAIDPVTGQATASPIEGFTQSEDAAADRALRERQIAVSEASQKRQGSKLSAGLEKALLASQDNVVTAQRNANEYDVLAADFARNAAELGGGVAQTFSEGLKSILGTQDDVTEFRRRFNKVRLSEGLKNLPPGPATDKDIIEAFKGVPKENANAEQVQSFLRGSARLARLDAAYNQFKADFISTNRSGGGLNKEWRRKIESPRLKRKVSNVEIYETAQNRGITVEEVKEQLGIK